MLVVPAGQGLAAQQAEPVALLGPREQHLPVVEQRQHTHIEAQDGPSGTDRSIGHSGCTSHGTAEMKSMDCSDHVPAKQASCPWQTVHQAGPEVTAAVDDAVPAEQQGLVQLLAVVPSCVQVVQLGELDMYVLQYQ